MTEESPNKIIISILILKFPNFSDALIFPIFYQYYSYSCSSFASFSKHVYIRKQLFTFENYILNNQMFQPNSIKSLLNKRTTSRLNSAHTLQNKQDNENYSKRFNDFDDAIEAKIMIKQIDSKIENIREWRNHQKLLTEEKLKCNSEIAKAQSSEYIQCLERQAQKEEEDLNKILMNLKKDYKEGIKLTQKEEEYDSQKIFQVLQETETTVQAIKNQDFGSQDLEHSKMLSELESLGHIFKKENYHVQDTQKNESAGAPEKFDMKEFMKEIDEIENEFKEIEELLGEDGDQAIPES